ncbi:MAG: VOC family protein [Chloroflexi bacterium]|nr:VOC family protein [Chloroflexota bacterium]
MIRYIFPKIYDVTQYNVLVNIIIAHKHTQKESEMSLPENLSIKATHLFLYYRDLADAQAFYEETLGFKRVLDFGFATIHQISPTSYVGLVDEARGMHKTTEPKTVTLSFITEEIDEWYAYLQHKGVEMHHPLGNATRHPTRGFVAYDPEGYFLEFETFLPHEENDKLRHQLGNSKAIYPQKDQKMTRPQELGVQGNIIWLYYKDLTAAEQFYENVMGLNLLTVQSFAKIYASSKTGFIGLVDEAQGLHRFSEKKCVTLSFFTDDVKSWFSHLKNDGVKLHTPSIMIESGAVENFVAYDVGGYFVEFDRFLAHEQNQRILDTLNTL